MFNVYIPTRFIFGNGRLAELHKQNLPGVKAMIVISNGKSVHENGALARTTEQLNMAGAASVLFAQIAPNPTKTIIMEGAKYARDK